MQCLTITTKFPIRPHGMLGGGWDLLATRPVQVFAHHDDAFHEACATVTGLWTLRSVVLIMWVWGGRGGVVLFVPFRLP